MGRGDRITPGEFVSLISGSLKANIKEVTPKELVSAMRSLAMCRIKDKDLGRLVADTITKKASVGFVLAPEEFCTLAWSFCVLELHHDDLFREFFKTVEEKSRVGGETLCRLYEIHLSFKVFHQDSYRRYELEEATVQNLREQYRRQKGGRSHAKLERASERVHTDATDLLRDVIDATVSEAYQIPSLGITVDIAAIRRKNSSSPPIVTIDIDGPHCLVRSLDPTQTASKGFAADSVGVGNATRVNGSTELKRRLLLRNDIRLVVMSEEQWRSLGKDREKTEFLRKLVSRAGVDKSRLL